MKLYRASYRDSYSEHTGFEYFSNRKDAETAQRENNKQRYGEELPDEELSKVQPFDEVTEIEFKLTKKGIIALLTQWATHPDNG